MKSILFVVIVFLLFGCQEAEKKNDEKTQLKEKPLLFWELSRGMVRQLTVTNVYTTPTKHLILATFTLYNAWSNGNTGVLTWWEINPEAVKEIYSVLIPLKKNKTNPPKGGWRPVEATVVQIRIKEAEGMLEIVPDIFFETMVIPLPTYENGEWKNNLLIYQPFNQ